MIKDEYKKLLLLIEQAAESEEVTLEMVLAEAVIFFEELRQNFPAAPKEEQVEMMEMMNNLQDMLHKISHKIGEETGLSEQQLTEIAENPSNFTPEQWRLVQDTKHKLYDSARKFSESIHEGDSSSEGAEEGEMPRKRPGPIKKTARRTRRKDWHKT